MLSFSVFQKHTPSHKTEINMIEDYIWDHRVLNFFFFFLQIYILQHPTPFSKQISIAYGT